MNGVRRAAWSNRSLTTRIQRGKPAREGRVEYEYRDAEYEYEYEPD
jgi:hypothetical protein